MVAADEGLAVRQSVRHRMPELRPRPSELSRTSQDLKVRIESNLAERDDDLHVRQGGKLRLQVGEAVVDLLRRWLVGGWRASDRGGDVRVSQRQAVGPVLRGRDIGVAGAVEGRHQEVAGAADAIAREDAAGAIRAVGRRRQADDEYPRPRIAEAGNRPCPVRLIAICAPLLVSDSGAVGAKTRAAIAGHDLLVINSQPHACLLPGARSSPKRAQ